MTADATLKAILERVATRQGRCRLWGRLAVVWTASAFVALLVIFLERQTGWASWLAAPLMATIGVVASLVLIARHSRTEPDWRQLARQIEARFPQLDGRLLTSIQQDTVPGVEPTYLQLRVLEETLSYSQREDWTEIIPKSRLALAQAAHWLALALCALVLWKMPGTRNHAFLARIADLSVTVSPGDTSIERGNSLVVLARFGAALPSSVELVLSPGGPALVVARRIPLVKSLADPVFGGSIPEIATNLTYRIEYAGERTRDFRVTVFEYPRLERADVDLTFPEYTGQPPKRIENTRRLSAVQGSRVDISLQLNKPVASARLITRDREHAVLPLLVETNHAMAALKQFPLESSKTYELQLVDTEGRTNKTATLFAFDALSNRAPEIRLAAPRGDVRPSAVEEISFEGTVWDDFGVKSYGLAYTLPGEETRYVELGKEVPAKEKRPFKYLLRLEELGLVPDQLVAWFCWADDIGADGQPRRTAGDLYFAEVRPFDEIFREGQQAGGSGEGSQGGQSTRLVDLQKKIISATWNLQRQHGTALPAERKGPASPGPKPGQPTKDSPPAAPRQSRAPGHRESDESGGFSLSSLGGEGWGEEARAGDDAPRVRCSAGFQPAVSQASSLRAVRTFPCPEQFGRPADWKSAIQQVGVLRYDIVLPSRAPASLPAWFIRGRLAGRDAGAPGLMGQIDRGSSGSPRPSRTVRGTNASNQLPIKGTAYPDDAAVVRDSQAQAIQQAEEASDSARDPRAQALWTAAVKEMEKALARLNQASNSPITLPDALAAEQAAYLALLKLQEHEYQVMRSRSRSQGGGGMSERMQRQLEQMEMTQSEDRYETQRQAQRQQNSQAREQLQVMNRLQELARRQQDLNDRLKELQTALQEARTEQEREEIRRRLKRLQEEQQEMLADVDELRQRMDRPENQSRMADERRKLDQTREDMQRAAEASGQAAASQALAAGTRAQRQLQQLRDQMRKENSNQFAEDLREMRAEARELARQQDEIQKQLDPDKAGVKGPKPLTDAPERAQVMNQLAQQKQLLTNLVERATQVSQQAEDAEPLLSRQLYDTLRKFNQDNLKDLKETQEELISRRLMSESVAQQLKQSPDQDAVKLMDLTSELLRQDFGRQASETAQRTRGSIANLKSGVERAAESVLGDDTEALKLAQQELTRVTEQLQREMAQSGAGGTSTNQQSSADGQNGERSDQSASTAAGQESAGSKSARASEQAARQGDTSSQRPGEQKPGESSSSSSPGQQPSETAQSGKGESGSQQGSQAGGQQPGSQPGSSGKPSAGQKSSGSAENQANAASGQTSPGGGGDRRNGGAYAGGAGGDWLNNFDRLMNDDGTWRGGPLTGGDYGAWSDRLRDVEEVLEFPELRNQVAIARERARLMRQEYKSAKKKPDWAVVQTQVMKPLLEVRARIADELARRESSDALVPIDRDPVPTRYSELVRRYYEELGRDKTPVPAK